MKALPDKSVDCFICDLPYGCLHPERKVRENIIKASEVPFNERKDCSWDIKLDLKAFWEQVERLAKNDHTPVLHFCNTKFGFDLITSKPDWFRYDLVWNKERGVSFLSANKMPMKSHEMIYIFSKKGAYYKRIDIDDPNNKLTRSKGAPDGKRCPLSVLIFNKVVTLKNKHPTEKPEELYEWLLKRYCPDGGCVLDPTAGSFNSILVAKKLGLKAIGIEKDRTYFHKAIQGALSS